MNATARILVHEQVRAERKSFETSASTLNLADLAVFLAGAVAVSTSLAMPSSGAIHIETTAQRSTVQSVVSSHITLDQALASAMIQHAQDLAHAQTYLTVEQSKVLYSRMRELILR